MRALEKLRKERQLRRELQGNPKFTTNEAALSGELVTKAENVYYSIGDLVLIKDFSLNILRGDKIALIGPNGIGKSTLLKVLLGQLIPQEGKVALGTNLQIGYFDQLRAGIDPKLSATENVAGGRETIVINGKEKHIISYLSDFLFTPERARTPVKMLSGGECNRLLLAKLFSLPNNLLVLDEPTNDLDIESLELLEDILVDYKGTLLLVSHDRSFVDEVATSTLYFAGEGKIIEYIGGYKDIPKTKPPVTKKTETMVHAVQTKHGAQAKDAVQTKNVDSRTKRELEEMPQKIAELESLQHQLQNEIAEPGFYNREKSDITATLEKLEKIDKKLQACYKRWEELERLL